jgi:acetylornithine deacetylase/succinyl-diaminopimelate desuccinylase-like protein
MPTVDGRGSVGAGEPVIDRAYLLETAQRLARVPTAVPLGFDTLREPDHPELVHYVQEVIRPELERLGYRHLIDVPRNNLVVPFGNGRSSRSLLIQNYTVVQHHHDTAESFAGRVEKGRLHGQGVTQCKAHQATMLAVLKALVGRELSGHLWWAVNNEGRSSHACSNAILDALKTRPEFCIVQIGTGLALSLGNRGRVDIDVVVEGEPAHSSKSGHPLSAIEGAAEVVRRVQALSWPDAHPLLGRRHATVYKIRYSPVAPHTLPGKAELTIDRRLLPGDSPTAATAELAEAIGDLDPFKVSVDQGVFMLPALVDPALPWVHALERAHQEVGGRPLATEYGQGSFDAGGPCARGVPTVMYGAGGLGLSTTGPDWIAVAELEQEAETLLELILQELS